jgi:hypothetical protein
MADTAQGTPVTGPATVGQKGLSRLDLLLNDLDGLLRANYAFDVFVPDLVNFGILVTYRQKWEPGDYQVGDLVSTIPLAPKEIRRYTTRTVTKKTRAVKEVEDALRVRKTESAETARVDSEIIEKAQAKTHFNLTAEESMGGGDTVPYKVGSTQTVSGDTSKDSQKTKRDFRESVLKSAEEYRQEHRTEIDTTESQETESTTFHEIQNPNDELPVTYLFYELQRTYTISEKLHNLTPVIFVANEVPAPHEITDAWLLEHDWILKRVILDDSFRPALEYLCTGFVGAELDLKILEESALLQKNLVDKLSLQVQAEDNVLSVEQKALQNAVTVSEASTAVQGGFDVFKSVFDPLGITGKTDLGAIGAAQTSLDYAREMLDRAEKEKRRLSSQLDIAVTALQAAIDKLSAAVKTHYGKLNEVDRLRVHVKENIIYYMQAIWSHEPPDQRFFRLYKLNVPKLTAQTVGVAVNTDAAIRSQLDALATAMHLQVSLPMPEIKLETQKLVEVADLDNLLGFKGNYMIFPLKENNYLTLHMMQDYWFVADDKILLQDPDEFGNYTADEIQELATCLYQKNHQAFLDKQDDFRKLLIDRLSSSCTDSDKVIVPTTSLYIEALVGTHPLLEDFKLIHRALDVKKVQAEVRHAELENIRLAARALRGKDEDPDIDKKIVIEANGENIALLPDA